MNDVYSHEEIEKKWQKRWEDLRLFEAEPDPQRPKFYCLVMLPYPSGFLHMGHVRNYSIGDALSWYKRLRGFNVIHPIGWDSFGQPAEQAAIKRAIQPREWTEENITHMCGQLKRLGISYDWRREIATHRPEYYRWNQWFFLKMFERDLVYKRMAPVNWCPKEETVLSNEQSSGGVCWRCKTEVEKREMEQWFIRITRYADELLDGMEEIRSGWPERVLVMQRNWIGRSENGQEPAYRLRDWCISRQRFWGTPIPVVYCDRCGVVPVPEKDLPVRLPEWAEFTGTGKSPLAGVAEFVNVACPVCSAQARRETDTMDTFVDSSWYFFRYCDPENSGAPFDPDKAGYWTPVDQYIGGIDQAVMHLLYARFWTRLMRDIGLVGFNEPASRLLTQGMVSNIVGESGEWKAMSKSLGNGVDPDRIIDAYGVDAVRLFVLFASPPEHELRWSEAGIEGMVRFLRRVHKTVSRWSKFLPSAGQNAPGPEEFTKEARTLRHETHRLIERVTEDFEHTRLNRAIAALMELTNALGEFKASPENASDSYTAREAMESLILMLVPFAPHFAEEMWEEMGNAGSILRSGANWPQAIDEWARKDEIEVPVQVNGKLRGAIKVASSATEEDLRMATITDERLREWIGGQEIVKVIVVPKRVVNVVTR